MPLLSRALSLNDPQIRAALRQKVIGRTGARGTMVVEELGLFHGATRVDLAVVGRSLHGYEIKSDRDSLDRLEQQAAAYNLVLDRLTVVTGWRHAVTIMRAAPRWWGVLLADPGVRGAIRFRSLRLAGWNPRPDARAVACLLWRDEALAILLRLGATGGTSRRRADLYEHLAKLVPEHRELSALVRAQLKRRADWRPGARLASSGG